jgi:hypothetical protein
MGQSIVYEEASQMYSELMGVEVSGQQIQRVSVYYGTEIDNLIKSNCEPVIPEIKSNKLNDTAYVMVDGSMIFTRDDKWKEMKLGMVFLDSQVIDIQKDRREIVQPVYVSHLGSVKEFFPKFERHLVPYKKKVIIGDGAKWIWNWAEDNYPGAIQILDFFHAKEKLVVYSKHQYTKEEKRKEWLAKQLSKLSENGVEEVIQELHKTRSRNEESKYSKQKTIDYFNEHCDRMEYKTYRNKGLLIGSGPIEAAHRSVLQQRMKLSGQRWSIKGAQAIANLRCYNKSNAWSLVKKIIRAAA